MFPKVKILNVDIDNVSLSELLPNLKEGVIVTPNVDHLMKLQRDYEFYRIYKEADYVICDSQIIYFASRFLNSPIKEKLCGSDFFPALCDYHKSNSDFRIFLLGGTNQSVQVAAARMNERYGRKIVSGFYSPPFGFEHDHMECMRILDKINESGSTVLAVGVGAPKQEKWISRYKKYLPNVKIFLAIGATIEFEAGTLNRAPRWMSDSGFEWMFRLICEPQRLWRRYLIDSLPFFRLLFMQKLKFYNDPFCKIKSSIIIRRPKEISGEKIVEKSLNV